MGPAGPRRSATPAPRTRCPRARPPRAAPQSHRRRARAGAVQAVVFGGVLPPGLRARDVERCAPLGVLAPGIAASLEQGPEVSPASTGCSPGRARTSGARSSNPCSWPTRSSSRGGSLIRVPSSTSNTKPAARVLCMRPSTTCRVGVGLLRVPARARPFCQEEEVKYHGQQSKQQQEKEKEKEKRLIVPAQGHSAR